MFIYEEILYIGIGMILMILIEVFIYFKKGWNKEVDREIQYENLLNLIKNKIVEKIPEWEAINYRNDKEIDEFLKDIVYTIEKRVK